MIRLFFFAALAATVIRVGSSSIPATDVSYEFDLGKESWGEATTSEADAQVYHGHQNNSEGHLRIQVTGSDPTIDSPKLLVPIRERLTIVTRVRAVCASNDPEDSFFRLRLSEPRESFGPHFDFGNNSWNNNTGDSFIDVPFKIHCDGRWHDIYSPITSPEDESSLLDLYLTQLRIRPCLKDGSSMQVEFVRLVRAPIIKRVSGCQGEKYSTSSSFVSKEYAIESQRYSVNDALYSHKTTWNHRDSDLEYGTAYNCLRSGGEVIYIEGANFDTVLPSRVFIDGRACTDVTHDPENVDKRLSCISPPIDEVIDESYGPLLATPSIVEVRNGVLPGLTDRKTYFSYAKAPPVPTNLSISNIASSSFDLAWAPGGSIWDHMIVTGYILRITPESSQSSSTQAQVMGNVTKTTLRGLEPDTKYFVSIAAIAEDQRSTAWWKNLDLYGKRSNTQDGALEGPVSSAITGHTLAHDILFASFDANSTLSHGAIDERASVGPTSIEHGEGHYGLNLVGDAGIQNCNSSSFCCDVSPNSNSCNVQSWTCRATAYRNSEKGRFIFEKASDTNINEIHSKYCGPALRLTGPDARRRGATWYSRPQEVAEGFITTFTLRTSEQSSRCNSMNGVHSRCHSRGGDGLAFVIQTEGSHALGAGGKGMGYDGIKSALAVEFDTYYNYDLIEPYENHASVHVGSSNHAFSLGHTNSIPQLTSGNDIAIKIEYKPKFDLDYLFEDAFVASPYVASFLESVDGEGLGAWGGNGLGMLNVFVMDLKKPVLTVPLNLSKTLKLDRGRAFIGFTAATGDETWQTHDVLDWTFSSFRVDSDYFPPVVVNGVGAYAQE